MFRCESGRLLSWIMVSKATNKIMMKKTAEQEQGEDVEYAYRFQIGEIKERARQDDFSRPTTKSRRFRLRIPDTETLREPDCNPKTERKWNLHVILRYSSS